jgi:hypothetical protein
MISLAWTGGALFEQAVQITHALPVAVAKFL